jgi:uncharacterized protein
MKEVEMHKSICIIYLFFNISISLYSQFIVSDSLHKAAKNGIAEAQYQIGLIYYEGNDSTYSDYTEAMKWFQLSANQGYAKAQSEMGFQYWYGEHIGRDYKQAFNWFMKAANQNNSYAQNFLGRLYEAGDGVEKNKEEAIEWYLKAADNNNQDARYALEYLYEEQDSKIYNEKEAYFWWFIAKSQEEDKGYSDQEPNKLNQSEKEDVKTRAMIWIAQHKK